MDKRITCQTRTLGFEDVEKRLDAKDGCFMECGLWL